ncbi:MAG: hypothetical protein AAGG75_00185 [Bacteroidota bacterium]
MQLSKYLLSLHELGEASLSPDLEAFAEVDQEGSITILQELYQSDCLEMPLQAPDFNPSAALWAAQQLYRISQLLLQRNWGPEIIDEHLLAYPHPLEASSTYSADLCLRQLPTLFELAKGLAPSDHLVVKLRQLGAQFPFSSVGIELDDHSLDVQPILAHPSLRYAYIDRIVAKKDHKRLQSAGIQPALEAQLGTYAAQFWPELNTSNH